MGSSPHTRGAPVAGDGVVLLARIIPAYAGSTTCRVVSALARPDHPRIRGEHWELGELGRHFLGSSPHTRGAPFFSMYLLSDSGIIPAYAGSTSTLAPPTVSLRDHPRIRGEHRGIGLSSALDCGSSPHTRGALGEKMAFGTHRGIIPAYAGSTPTRRRLSACHRDHPRIRGEHTASRRKPSRRRGSSPHTRGALPATGRRETAPRDHPRIRGEHGIDILGRRVAKGSSPHTRGARSWLAPLRLAPRIIPAYAGSTPAGPPQVGAEKDHPRIRGEHILGCLGISEALGSSPHTRGARA